MDLHKFKAISLGKLSIFVAFLRANPMLSILH